MSTFMLDVGDPVGMPSGEIGVIQELDGTDALVVLESGNSVRMPIDKLLAEVAYLEFNCDAEHGGCGAKLQLNVRLEPGQACPIKCDNCGENWTVYAPSLEVHKTDEFEPIWKHIGQ